MGNRAHMRVHMHSHVGMEQSEREKVTHARTNTRTERERERDSYTLTHDLRITWAHQESQVARFTATTNFSTSYSRIYTCVGFHL